MARYMLEFSKEGYITFTSHLDMIRLFKRSFKKAGLRLEYSQGFNPHPKMSFAQPLSLGYTGKAEWLEFALQDQLQPCEIMNRLKKEMPTGIMINQCSLIEGNEKTLASRCKSATYTIRIPLLKEYLDGEKTMALPLMIDDFIKQEHISAMKKVKKKRDLVEIDIKPMIHHLSIEIIDDNIFMYTHLDAGSVSNLSPELLLQALLKFINLPTPREAIDITRESLEI